MFIKVLTSIYLLSGLELSEISLPGNIGKRMPPPHTHAHNLTNHPFNIRLG